MTLFTLKKSNFATKESRKHLLMTVYRQIFEDFKTGDITPFYKVMYPELIVYVAKILGNEFSFLAEDCVQDAVLKTYDSRNDFDSPLQWKVYLYTCIRNSALNILRKGQARTNYIGNINRDSDKDESLMLDIIEQETLTLLYEAIEALPQELRQLFELSFEQGLKNAEVAAQLSVAEITIKKRKARLINLLRSKLKGRMDETMLMLLLTSWTTEM